MANERCETCTYYQSFDGASIDYGECKFNPPQLIGFLLFYLSSFFQNVSPQIQRRSSMWPVVKGSDDFCDKHTD